MSAITTHVLDLSTGRPAANVAVKLERKDDSGWRTVADRATDGDGRVRDFLAPGDNRYQTLGIGSLLTGVGVGMAIGGVIMLAVPGPLERVQVAVTPTATRRSPKARPRPPRPPRLPRPSRTPSPP